MNVKKLILTLQKAIFLTIVLLVFFFSFKSSVNAQLQQSVQVSATVYACEIELLTDTTSNDEYLLSFNSLGDNFEFKSRLLEGKDLVNICNKGIYRMVGKYTISFKLANTYIVKENIEPFKMYRNKMQIVTKNSIGNGIICNDKVITLNPIKPKDRYSESSFALSISVIFLFSNLSKITNGIYLKINKLIKLYINSIVFCYNLLKRKIILTNTYEKEIIVAIK